MKFNGTAGTPTSWSATSIVVPVPSGATTGNVVVTVGGVASNGVSFSVGLVAKVTLIQHASVDAGTTASSSLAFASSNTAGNWIGVCVRAGAQNETITVTDTKGNTYKKAISFNETSDGNTVGIYYAENIGGGANTVKVVVTSSTTLRFAILEYSGVATSGSLDVTATAQGSGTAANMENAVTTASGGLLLGTIMTGDPKELYGRKRIQDRSERTGITEHETDGGRPDPGGELGDSVGQCHARSVE